MTSEHRVVSAAAWCQREEVPGQTASCIASSRGYAEVVRPISNRGADPKAK